MKSAKTKKPKTPKQKTPEYQPLNPIQPTITDEHGYVRFKPNALVRHLLDNGKITMNDLALVECSRDDRQQFAQLIGYSLGGYSDLSYHSESVYVAAQAAHTTSVDVNQARVDALEAELKALKGGLRGPIARLYQIAEEDLAWNTRS